MGIKSRTNWQINLCLKKDCINKGIKCKNCIKFSKYKKENK